MNLVNYAAITLPKISNPFTEVSNKIQALNDKVDQIVYWGNPAHWVTGIWDATSDLFHSGNADIFLLIATIGAIWLIQLGAQKPKKYLFWSWIVFWVLRGGIFA